MANRRRPRSDAVDPQSNDRHPRLFRSQWPVPARPLLERHSVAPRRDRQDGHPPYDITRDDRLRNFVDAERISPTAISRSPAGPSRACASTISRSEIPIALPAIDARFRLDDPVLGGKVELQANSLAILRIDGQDTQRAFASARWDLRKLTRMGQEVTLTAFARGDAYHTRRERRDRRRRSTAATEAGSSAASAPSPPT